MHVAARTLKFKQTWRVTGGSGFFRGLAYGGGSLWVTQISGNIPNEGAVTRVDPRTGARRKIDLAAHVPTGLVWSEGYGDLWIANFNDGTLTRLHDATGATTTVSGDVANPAFSAVDGDAVWIGDWSQPLVARLDAVGRPRAHSVWLPVRNPIAGVWDVAAGAGAVWATTPRDGAVWRIDPKTNAVRRVDVPFMPSGVAADANDVWVTVRKS